MIPRNLFGVYYSLPIHVICYSFVKILSEAVMLILVLVPKDSIILFKDQLQFLVRVLVAARVRTDPWKVLEFYCSEFQAWKVLEKGIGPGKPWKVLEF